LAKAAIDALAAEMAKPTIAASALKAIPQHRELKFVNFVYGYKCSLCHCRFPESRTPEGRTAAETRRLVPRQCEKEFAEHLCPMQFLQ
jgi:hypothetical protein